MPHFDRLVVITSSFMAAIQGTLAPLFALMMAESIHLASSSPPDQVLHAKTRIAKLMLALCGVGFVATFIWTTGLFWFAARQTARLRIQYFEGVLSCDVGWFDQNQPAALPAKMVTESKKIHEAIGPRTGEVVMNLTQFVLTLVIAFARGWELTLVVCGAIPVIIGMGRFTTHRVKLAMRDHGEWMDGAGAIVEESLLAIRTVSAFGAEGREVARLEKALAVAKRAGIRAATHAGLSFGFLFFFFCCAFAMAFWYGSHYMIATNRYSQTDFIVVVICVILGVSALSNLEGPLDIFVQAIGATLSMHSLLNVQPEIEPLEDDGKEQCIEVAVLESIEFRGVHFSYPARPDLPILRGFELCISQGQKVALVGGSGSGKSTVVQLFERFYDPHAGGVLVNGVPLPRLPVHSWRRLLGYVGQEPVLLQCSVLENIRGGNLDVTDERCLEAARHAEVFDFVSTLPLGFDTVTGVGGSLLSGGQKQRLAIARALARRPQLLILDEATSALDEESERQVQATLDRLQRTACRGLGSLSVAHRLSTIRDSDEICVLRDGRVAERGSHAELMAARGDYFSLVQTQSAPQAKDGTDECNGAPNSPSQHGGASTPAHSTITSHRSLPSPAHNQPPLPAKSPRSMRRLVGWSKPEWVVYPAALLSTLLSGSYQPLQGLCISRVFTSLSLQPVEDMLAAIDRYTLALLVLGIVVFLGELGKHVLFGYIQQALTLRLQKMTFASMMNQEIGFFDDPSSGAAGLSTELARMTADVSLMTGIGIGNTMQSLFGVSVGLAVGFLGCAELTLVVLALLPLVAASMVTVAQVLTDPSDSEAGMADGVAASAVLNIRAMRAFNSELYMRQLFSQAAIAAAAREVRRAPRKGLALSVSGAVTFMTCVFGMWYGAWLITAKGLEAEEVYQSLFCVTIGFSGASLAASYGPILRRGQLSAGALLGIIDREPRVRAQIQSDLHRSLGDGTIQFQDVSFCFPHRKEACVLKSMSFSVARGQTVALVGPSGSGKSTIIQLLLRFYDPTCGSIRVGGMDLAHFDLAWWRRQVGLVSQEPVLFDMSLEDNVKYGFPEATRAEVEAAERLANMDYAFNGMVTREDSLGLRGERLSSGQKQRCAIARAIVRRPEVLLFDEATSALDSASEHMVQMALDNARKGRTTFTITHRLNTIKDSELVLVISSGRILERGTHDELLAMHAWYANTVALH